MRKKSKAEPDPKDSGRAASGSSDRGMQPPPGTSHASASGSNSSGSGSSGSRGSSDPKDASGAASTPAGSDSTRKPTASGDSAPARSGSTSGSTSGSKSGSTSGSKSGSKSGSSASSSARSGQDPLRRSRAGGIYVGVVALGVLLVLLIIFISQNTAPTTIRFLVWEGQVAVSVAILAAAAAGIFLAGIAASLRILQLRRRVKHDRKATASS